MTATPQQLDALRQLNRHARTSPPATRENTVSDPSSRHERYEDIPLPPEPLADDMPPVVTDEDNAPAIARASDRNRTSAPARQIKLTPASQIKTSVTEWLIENWIPRGAVTLLAGREGIGKSTVAVDWVAQATRGDLTDGEPLNVGYVVTEDSREHTVVPRLLAAGADLDRVAFIDATVRDDTNPANAYDVPLDLPGDFPLLGKTIEHNDIGLVILDAAKSVMNANLNDYKDTDVRKFLEPMSMLAEKTGCTFVGLAHFGKKETADTGKLLSGSSAWSQVARSVMSVVADKDQGTIKVWNSKANLAKREMTMEARISSAPFYTSDDEKSEVGKVEWIGECSENGESLLSGDEHDDEDKTEVEQWLEDYLTENGPCPRTEVFRAAKKSIGVSESTIKRAFRKLDGLSQSGGFPRTAHWSLPGRGYTGEATEPPDSTVETDTRAAILDHLDTDHKQSADTIIRTVTEMIRGATREMVTDQLTELSNDGIIHQVNGKYIKEK